MRTVIVGAGKVGFELAKRLAEEGHDVVLIDQNEEALTQAGENLDVQVMAGNGASASILEAASAGHSDLFVAVTNVDEVNIVSCMAAKKLGARQTVARLRAAESEDSRNGLLRSIDLGIDLAIRPEQAVAYHIVRLLRTPSATDVEYLAGGKVQMLGFRVQDGSPLAHRTVEQANLTYSTVGAILRDGEALIPHGRTRIEPGDEIFIVGKTGVPSEVGWLVGGAEQAARSVVIAGGGRTGTLLAQFLEKHRRHGPRVEIIERDREVCDRLSRELTRTLAIHGDAAKPDVLRDESVNTADAVVALTGSDEANLLIGFMAKHGGTPRVIVRTEREDYAPVASQMNIDSTVVPRVIVAGAILRLVHSTSVKSLSYLREGNLELMEVEVQEGCQACGKTIRELGFPRGAVVGALIRGDRVIVPRGATTIATGDHLVILATPFVVSQVEYCFRE